MAVQEGMPAPAPKPKGTKIKFTAEDDALLVELKKTRNLTWKQISNFFPGRSPGTLQVRYCTKLKAKTTAWTDDMIEKLHTAMDEYEDDRWRIISGKVGNGFSAAACRKKAAKLVRPEVAVPSTPCNQGDKNLQISGNESSVNCYFSSLTQENKTCTVEVGSEFKRQK
ncbi:hypothetical protein LTR49_028638, partial [Elasticomyces elasticus]